MAKLKKEELLNCIRAVIGEENTSDEALKLIEDVSDTIDSYSSTQNEDWEKKYHELDQEWRTKYRDRFFSATPEETQDMQTVEEPQKEEPLTYEALLEKLG